MFGCWRSSANTYVFWTDVACVIRSAAARGELADLARATKGARAFRARVCSMLSMDVLQLEVYACVVRECS